MVYDKGPNQFTVVYCDTGRSLSSDFNSNMYPSQARASATPPHFILLCNSHWLPWGKSNRLLHLWQNLKIELSCSWLAFFPLSVFKLPVKSPCTMTIISRCAPVVLLVVAGHGGCYQIFGIWINRISSYPFWKLIYWLLGCATIGTISLWPSVFLDMSLIATLVTNYIWSGR